MSQSSDVVVLDIGSRALSAYVAERLSDDNFAVKASCEIEYDGYLEGEWLKEDDVLPSLFKILDKLERTVGKIKTLYVGVPADFCVVRTVYDKVSFPKAKRVLPSDVQDLFEANDPFRESVYQRIHADAVYYIDDRGERMRDPVGRVTTYLKAQISYIGAEEERIAFLRQGLLRHGVKNVRFIQSERAAALTLFSEEERDAGVLVADIGYLATSVMRVVGDAVVDMRTFALGGAMVPAGLSGKLEVPFRVASALTSKINIGYKDEGEYTLQYDATSYVFTVSEVNEVAKECVHCVASYVQRAIHSFRFDCPQSATVFVTGGGFSEMRCSREYLAKCLGRNVEIVLPSTPNFSKPYYSTAVGLIRAAMKIEKNERFGFLKRLFNV